MRATTMSIAEASRWFMQFPQDFAEDRSEINVVEVVSQGKPVMAVLSWELYEGVMETLDVMGDRALMKKLRQSLREAEQGKALDWEMLRERQSVARG